MGRKFKDFLSDLLAGDERIKEGFLDRNSTGYERDGMEDEEALTQGAPYKLEPSLSAAEKYLNNIRRQGW